MKALAAIRPQYAIPAGFPPEVLAEAERTKDRAPTAHADWTARAFVTLDPATSPDPVKRILRFERVN